MKTKKIEKTIFNILAILPLLMILTYFCLNFASLWSTGNNVTSDTILTNFNSIMGSIGSNSDFIAPIKYLIHDIFGLSDTLASSLSIYVMYMILIELVHVLFNLIMYLPRLIRSLTEKGLNN